jgi:acyl carrier protein
MTEISAKGRILESIRSIVGPWVSDEEAAERIDEETDLLTEVGLDSIGVLHLVLGVEKEFGMKIEDFELNSEMFSRAGNFVELVQKKVYETDRPA